MSEEDFMKAILADSDAPVALNAQSRALESIKKFNLPNRFNIHVDKAIPQLSGNFSRAFEVNDSGQKQDIYALIFPSNVPIRFHVIQQLKSVFNHSFTNVVETGLTDVAGGQYGNYAVILERPKGRKISEFLKELKAQRKDEHSSSSEIKSLLSEAFITQEVVHPINEILRTLSESNVSHGRINHDNVFITGLEDSKTMLGECISEPCGYSQPFHYETIDRAQSMPLGKGNSTLKHDYFALGVLIYYCIFGDMPAFGMEHNELLRARINKGTYNVFVGNSELSPQVTDILRGLLTDNPHERWGYEQVSSWIKGKRFNLIRPNLRKEAVRNYEFAENIYVNKRALAMAYHQKWDEAAFDIRDRRLVKWLELSANDKNAAAEITSIVAGTGGEKTKSRQDNDELIAKALIVLDGDAPLRFRDISMHLEGMGAVLANAWVHQSPLELQHLVEIIRINLPDFKAVRDPDNERIDRWTLQRQHNYIKFKTLGFGLERVLYDLNPTLPCQSQMLANQFVIDCSQLLFFLNDNATKLINNDPVDRHIAAFICSKLELATEVKLKVMQRFSRNDNAVLQLTKLAILAFAQKKTKVHKLPGLGNWMLEKLKVITNTIHNRAIRREFQDELKNLATQGNLESMLSFINAADYFARDDDGFNQARQLYAALDSDLKQIRDRTKLNIGQDAYYVYGLQFSKIIAAMVFLLTFGLMVPW